MNTALIKTLKYDLESLNVRYVERLSIDWYLHKYPKGQILAYQDELKDKFFFLKQGIVKVEYTDSEGKYFYLDYFSSGTFFPLQDLFSDQYYAATYIAYTPITVYSSSMSMLEQELKDSADFLRFSLEQLSEQHMLNKYRIQYGVSSDSLERIRISIYLLGYRLGKTIDQGHIEIQAPITINELALLSGTSRETTSILVKKLVSLKKLKYERKKMILLDPFYFDPVGR